jgi:hypothetical protein
VTADLKQMNRFFLNLKKSIFLSCFEKQTILLSSVFTLIVTAFFVNIILKFYNIQFTQLYA